MPVLNLCPAYWYTPPGGTAWTPSPATGTDQLYAPDDGKLLTNIINQGGADSSPVQASSFLDTATGASPVWNNKLITRIDMYVSAGQLVRPNGNTNLQIVAAKASNPSVNFFEVISGEIQLTQTPWQLIAGDVVNPPPTVATVWDQLRDWILANDVMYSLLHYYHAADAAQSYLLYDACLYAVTYNDVTPPAAKLPFITEF